MKDLINSKLVTPILAAICIILIIIIFVGAGSKPKILSKKLSPAKVIEIAKIDGVSLSTPIKKIDSMMEAEKFKCAKTDNSNTNKNSNTSSRIIWSCDHETPLRAKLYITAIDGKITNINRSGSVDINKARDMLDYIDELKLSLDTRESMYITQSPAKTTFSINSKSDEVTKQLQFNISLYQVKGEGEKMIDQASLSAIITKR